MELEWINQQAYKEFMSLPKPERKEFADALSTILGDQGDLSLDKYRTGQGVTSKPLKRGGWRGVVQLSINGSPAYRVVYCAKFGGRLYVLHTWTKTAQGNDEKEMKVVDMRWKEMVAELRAEGLIK